MLQYKLPVGGEALFLCADFRRDPAFREATRLVAKYYKEVPKNASQNHAQMQRMQAEKLQYLQEQEEHTRQARVEQVLSVLPEAHRAF